MQVSFSRVALAATCATLLMMQSARASDDEAPEPKEPPESSERKADDTAPDQSENAKYWLGIRFKGIDESLRAHLDLPDGVGMQVVGVFDDSPAAMAGIKEHDIVLEINGRPLNDAQKLVQWVEDSGGEEMSIKLLRSGKEKTLNVKPDTHPAQTGSDVIERDEVIHWLEEGVDPEKILRHPIGVRLFNRGLVLPPGERMPGPRLPKGMSVTVHREGDKPAKITVKKGDEEWDVTEGELDELPKDVRTLVEPLVMAAPVRIRLDGRRPAGQPFPGAPPQPAAAPRPPFPPADTPRHEDRERHVERQLEELSRQMERMQQALKDLERERESAK